MAHDQRFKEFLRDFLGLFFPEIEARLDFSALRFLDTESFTGFPEGSSREADILAEVRPLVGEARGPDLPRGRVSAGAPP